MRALLDGHHRPSGASSEGQGEPPPPAPLTTVVRDALPPPPPPPPPPPDPATHPRWTRSSRKIPSPATCAKGIARRKKGWGRAAAPKQPRDGGIGGGSTVPLGNDSGPASRGFPPLSRKKTEFKIPFRSRKISKNHCRSNSTALERASCF